MRGIKIDRSFFGRARVPSIIGNSMRGVNRSNATHQDFDRFKLYGITPEGFVVINLRAPGGHKKSVKPNSDANATAYLLDNSLVQHAVNVAEQEDLDFFPLRFNEGKFFGIHDTSYYYPEQLPPEFRRRVKESLERIRKEFDHPDKPHINEFRYAVCKAFALEIFKEDELGIVIESLLDSQENLEALLASGKPVMGIQTYDHRKVDLLAQDVTPTEEILNKIIAQYLTYIKESEYPYQREQRGGSITDTFFSAANNGHNNKITEMDLSGVQEWHMVDSLAVAKMRPVLIESAHSLASSALENAGYSSEGFKLIRFIKKHQKDELTVHYDSI